MNTLRYNMENRQGKLISTDHGIIEPGNVSSGHFYMLLLREKKTYLL